MGVITETEPGGEIVCILGFSARPRDADREPIPGERRTFRVGERVRYLGSFHKATPEDNPTGWMVTFAPLDPKDRNHYAATRDYFVTLDCWEGIRKHIASTLVVADRAALGAPREATAFRLVPVPAPRPRRVRPNATGSERSSASQS